MSPDIIGWVASGVLLATLIRQIHKQATDDNIQGISSWLFAGQILASIGFIVYSWMLHNWVFIVTNSLILITALTGQWVLWRKSRRSPPSRHKSSS